MISTLPRMFPRENSRLTRHRQLYCVVNKLNATNAMSGDDKSRHLVARTPSPQKHTTATTKIAVNSGKLSAGMLKTASLYGMDMFACDAPASPAITPRPRSTSPPWQRPPPFPGSEISRAQLGAVKKESQQKNKSQQRITPFVFMHEFFPSCRGNLQRRI